MDSLMNLLNNLMLRIGVWLQTVTVGMDPEDGPSNSKILNPDVQLHSEVSRDLDAI